MNLLNTFSKTKFITDEYVKVKYDFTKIKNNLSNLLFEEFRIQNRSSSLKLYLIDPDNRIYIFRLKITDNYSISLKETEMRYLYVKYEDPVRFPNFIHTIKTKVFKNEPIVDIIIERLYTDYLIKYNIEYSQILFESEIEKNLNL